MVIIPRVHKEKLKPQMKRIPRLKKVINVHGGITGVNVHVTSRIYGIDNRVSLHYKYNIRVQK